MWHEQDDSHRISAVKGLSEVEGILLSRWLVGGGGEERKAIQQPLQIYHPLYIGFMVTRVVVVVLRIYHL